MVYALDIRDSAMKKDRVYTFSYYGSKAKIASRYPEPIHDTITEPFAGAARYSCLYYDKNVVLYDIYEPIYRVWNYLINDATYNMVIGLPDVPNATVLESINGFSQLSQEEKWLIAFCANGGSSSPKNVSGRHDFNVWNKTKKNIAESLSKIRHWKVYQKGYDSVENKTSTWFIDPPYQGRGKWYVNHAINYNDLSSWCLERRGQVIVCENYGADWLPFERLVEVPFVNYKSENDKKKKTVEAMFYWENTSIPFVWKCASCGNTRYYFQHCSCGNSMVESLKNNVLKP